VTLTDRDRKLLLFLVPIVVLAAYWFLVLSPKRHEAKTAQTQLQEQQQRLDVARASAQSGNSAKQSFDTSYARLVRLGKAIPTSIDMPSLIVQLDAAAAGTGIRFTKIATGDQSGTPATTTASGTSSSGGSSGSGSAPPVAAGGQTAQSAPGGAVESANNASKTSDKANNAAEKSGVSSSDTQTSTTAGASSASSSTAAPAGLETVPLQLEFTGNFFNLEDFFHRVKRFVQTAGSNVAVSGRLITIDGIKWSSDDELFPQIKAEIAATVYLSPKAEGATAGATPQGPATTPAGSSTPSGGSSPSGTSPASAPTATATP
jgi:Tfp pilus assembly protein PilO